MMRMNLKHGGVIYQRKKTHEESFNKGEKMNKARSAFESFMETKGKDIANLWNGNRYTNTNINTKWRYFYMGWTTNQGK